ncbi:acetaldehyde dehydrogenase (acetylating) [Gordonia sp. UBA7599]|uniref:acetaldehyde dehydrogenase (acetylating) n=1 Tax=unclassified Gordonia (in: high G+C Gram-positive bacteria) TaxID=2657482 RepID=UPI000FB23BFF|nr:acetaldehyde dehydrogenase (acetylating) [Gordonia sp. UBA7599]RUP38615.1 MAG: acetaldehyde dehydrogenase (acetylating) [Gordonia sp. (in: high G+C Gram-positive bacteria)]HNP56221.1 acetaldehyde dehydrogenase (acetylating) [Gordonia sp. (in: high G+C Gram-positive bacteria)]
MSTDQRTAVAIIGSGNIGTDLMIKIQRLSDTLEVVLVAGIDPLSDGLARARRLGISTTHEGLKGIVEHERFSDIAIVFDATSAAAHKATAATLQAAGKKLVDLTPAAIGPFVVPAVNLDEHLDAININMVTCGGQATIPVVASISRVVPVRYAEIVASISSMSAGPGTRANIDEFTETTSRAIETVGGAEHGKAIIILNPADPPVIMRDTVLCLIDDHDEAHRDQLIESITTMISTVAAYVPGYRLKQEIQISPIPPDAPVRTLTNGAPATHKVTVFLEVEGAAHYLPAYAGNLDIMTSAALRAGEELAR